MYRRKITLLVLVILLVALLFGCLKKDAGIPDESSFEHEISSINALILRIDDNSFMVEPLKSEVLEETNSRVTVMLSKAQIIDIDGSSIEISSLEINSEVEITFEGSIEKGNVTVIKECLEVKVLSKPSLIQKHIKLSAEEAKKIIDSEKEYILLDVRTEEEYIDIRIKGSVLIPDYEIEKRIEDEIPNKDILILVYCRSGRRSANAVKMILSLGYTSVYDIGGIIDWPYETISG